MNESLIEENRILREALEEILRYPPHYAYMSGGSHPDTNTAYQHILTAERALKAAANAKLQSATNRMNEFLKRNAIRNQQFEYAKSKWVKTVGDRVQVSADCAAGRAWEAGTIIGLRDVGLFGESTISEQLVDVEMDNGTIYNPQLEGSGTLIHATNLPLVPHEDYFKDEPAAPSETRLVE